MSDIEDLPTRAATALEDVDQLEYVFKFAELSGEVVCAALAMAGRKGVFVGYGLSNAAAQVDAWRNFRDRGGHGYKVVTREEQEKARAAG